MTPALQQAMAYLDETRDLTPDEVGRIIREATMTWTGTRVRHEDGRTGIIRDDGFVVGYTSLTIRCNGENVAHVTLNNYGMDSGDTGWFFLSDDNGREPMWIQLGDHWTPEATP